MAALRQPSIEVSFEKFPAYDSDESSLFSSIKNALTLSRTNLNAIREIVEDSSPPQTPETDKIRFAQPGSPSHIHPTLQQGVYPQYPLNTQHPSTPQTSRTVARSDSSRSDDTQITNAYSTPNRQEMPGVGTHSPHLTRSVSLAPQKSTPAIIIGDAPRHMSTPSAPIVFSLRPGNVDYPVSPGQSYTERRLTAPTFASSLSAHSEIDDADKFHIPINSLHLYSERASPTDEFNRTPSESLPQSPTFHSGIHKLNQTQSDSAVSRAQNSGQTNGFKIGSSTRYVVQVSYRKAAAKDHFLFDIRITPPESLLVDTEYVTLARYSTLLEIHKNMVTAFPAAARLPFPKKRLLGNSDPQFLTDRAVELMRYFDFLQRAR